LIQIHDILNKNYVNFSLFAVLLCKFKNGDTDVNLSYIKSGRKCLLMFRFGQIIKNNRYNYCKISHLTATGGVIEQPQEVSSNSHQRCHVTATGGVIKQPQEASYNNHTRCHLSATGGVIEQPPEASSNSHRRRHRTSTGGVI
jgi:hypothetical protein